MLQKPLLGLDCVFYRQRAMFNQNTKFPFAHFFLKGKNSVPYTTAIRKEMSKMSWKLDNNFLKDGTVQKSHG